MRRYFYQWDGIWLYADAYSRSSLEKELNSEVSPDEIYTERQAQKMADAGNKELANTLQCAALCDLMC